MHINVSLRNESGTQIRKTLRDQGVKTNKYAEVLLDSVYYKNIPKKEYTVRILTLKELGFTAEPTLPEIHQQVINCGFELCPLQLAPYLRLKFTTQRVSKNKILTGQKRSPDAAINVLTPVISADTNFPKGFYLRNVDNELWLRGFICGDAHHWDIHTQVAVVLP